MVLEGIIPVVLVVVVVVVVVVTDEPAVESLTVVTMIPAMEVPALVRSIVSRVVVGHKTGDQLFKVILHWWRIDGWVTGGSSGVAEQATADCSNGPLLSAASCHCPDL